MTVDQDRERLGQDRALATYDFAEEINTCCGGLALLCESLRAKCPKNRRADWHFQAVAS